MPAHRFRPSWLAVLLVCACADVETVAPPEGELRNLPLQMSPDVSAVEAPLDEGFCKVQVDGRGLRDLENDYLPHVLQCEAAASADLESLKALAVAARSVAYYAMAEEGSICDGQGCQVYSCGRTPDALHVQAVAETQGVYLMSNDTLTYGFYVAGDSTPDASCVGNSGTTEKWVTYNEGRSGTNVTQTRLGFRFAPTDFGYGQNRGCLSQWGAVCLEKSGRDWRDILRFYYGDDIEIVQAQGECITPIGEEPMSEDESGESGDESGSCDEPITPRMDEEDPLTPAGPDRGGVNGCSIGTANRTLLWMFVALPFFRRRRAH